MGDDQIPLAEGERGRDHAGRVQLGGPLFGGPRQLRAGGCCEGRHGHVRSGGVPRRLRRGDGEPKSSMVNENRTKQTGCLVEYPELSVGGDALLPTFGANAMW